MTITINNIDTETLRRAIVETADQKDLGAAVLFKMLYEGRVLNDSSIDPSKNSWNVWMGTHWAQVPTADVRADAMQIMAPLYEMVANEFSDQAAEMRVALAKIDKKGADHDELLKDLVAIERQIEVLQKQAGSMRKLSSARDMMAVAMGLPGMSTDGKQWDQNPWLFAVKNGILDLTPGQKATLRNASPEDYIRTFAPIEYVPGAKAPKLEMLLEQLFYGNPEKDAIIHFLKRFFGSALTGKIHKLFLIFYGEGGNNGKTTLLELMKLVMGEYAVPIKKSVLIESGHQESSRDSNPQMARMMGKRLVWVDETKRDEELNIAVVKSLTGGNMISTRENYGSQVEFAPTHKVVMITNHKPRIDSSDPATWRRVCLIGFENLFTSKPEGRNQFKVIEDFHKVIFEQEASGVLNWLIEGRDEWDEMGTLGVPESLLADTAKYREEQNTIAQWIDEMGHVKGAEYQTPVKIAFDNYREWELTANGKRVPMIRKQFMELMAANGFPRSERTTTGYSILNIGMVDRVTISPRTAETLTAEIRDALKKRDYERARSRANMLPSSDDKAWWLDLIKRESSAQMSMMELVVAQ